jgi:hypothetical protein
MSKTNIFKKLLERLCFDKNKKNKKKIRSPYNDENAESDLNEILSEQVKMEEKLKKYHEQFPQRFQTEYFNKKENDYYSKLLKEELIKKKAEELKLSINFKETGPVEKGTFGVVCRGYDENNDIEMAVKKIFIANSNETVITKMVKEFQILQQMNHKNIVKVYGYKIKNEFLHIFMEYVNMGSISSVLQNFQKLEENVVSIYTYQILKGLEYLHYHKIIHRDIKGANLLVNQEGVVKLGDFGSAVILENTYFDSLTGTPCWMAPEVF